MLTSETVLLNVPNPNREARENRRNIRMYNIGSGFRYWKVNIFDYHNGNKYVRTYITRQVKDHSLFQVGQDLIISFDV